MEKSILISAPIITSILMVCLNLGDKSDQRTPYLLISLVVIGIVYFIYGLLISFFASKEECDKTSPTRAIYHGILTSVVMLCVYAIIYKVGIFKTPFTKIFTNEKVANCVAQITYMVPSIIGISLLNSDNSTKKVCDLTPKEIRDNLQKYNDYLNHQPPTREEELDIEVR